MTTRIPTMNLRFVERPGFGPVKVRILQQLVGFANGAPAKWEDVPTYTEAPQMVVLPVISPEMLEVGK